MLLFRIISIIFFVIMTLFSLYQAALGNPFFDAVNPVYVIPLYAVLAGVGVYLSFRKEKKEP